MSLFDVYPLYPINLVKAKNCYVWDENNTKYLDMYGGHGVISVGHGHERYIKQLKEQLDDIGFYSNSVINSLQIELAKKLKSVSDCENYNLFLCNSGAEANENALKLASFQTDRKRIVAFKKGFHGRTSGAVAVTDNEAIKAPLNKQHEVTLLPLNDIELVRHEIGKGDVAAIIVEGIQGIGGLDKGKVKFFKKVQKVCKKYGTLLILDEIQSGYGRSGKFFAFQYYNIQPDLITIAKGMGNGFPIAGVLISEGIEAKKGLLGTTFGGNHLACAAGIAVLDIIKKENLIENVNTMNAYFIEQLNSVPGVKKVKGKGLMLGLKFDFEVADLRKKLILDHHVFTGGSADKNLIRILPPMTITKTQIDEFVYELKAALTNN